MVLKLGLIKEGLKKIAGRFATLENVGSKGVAEFDESPDDQERTLPDS